MHNKARWICDSDCPQDSAPVFEKRFSLECLPEQAFLRISGLGFYVLEINGCRVGNELLQPAFSNYCKTVYYNEPDIKEFLKLGENVIHVTLGNGWFNETIASAWKFECAPWRGTPCLIAELIIEGNTFLVSDTSWLCSVSGWTFNSLRCGESFDARIKPVFDKHASIACPPGGLLKKQTIEPIRVRRIIMPSRPFAHRQYIYNFGVNLSGDVEIRVKGERGAKIVIHFVEQLLDNQAVSYESIKQHVYSKRFQTNEFILSGKGEEVWHSEFSYNGFQYASVSIENGKVQVLSVVARQFHTDLKDAAGIKTDNEMVQVIHNACRQSTLTNFHHIPTDCPHREKNGWTGDGHVSCEQALFNFDMQKAYEKWVDDIVDCQWPNGAIPSIVPTGISNYQSCNGPSYDAVLFEVPWQLYRYTGDKRYLTRWFESMKRYTAYMESITDDGVSVRGLGDWCALDLSKWENRYDLLTGYAVRIAELYSKIAEAIEDMETVKSARELEARMRYAFSSHFGHDEKGDMAYYSMVLHFNLTTDRNWAMNKLTDILEESGFHMGGGLVSTKCVLDALTDNGRFDLAWRLASQREFPGWYYMVQLSHGGTLTESWRGGSSQNHHMFSEIGAWFYKALAGFIIDDEYPGFAHVRLMPHTPNEINHFAAWKQTPHGTLRTEWDEKELVVTIPNGITANFVYGGKRQTLTDGQHRFARIGC